ncbi:MAG: radical SAM protein, partial [Firmicutes bacterium]|nr:radical SAM protein [Bacillota bacterium]
VAGRGRGIENAEKTAEFLNMTRPESITNFSMFVHKDAPVFKEIDAGNFEPADELECLKEERRLIELLDIDGVLFDGFHDFIEVRIRGTLPRDREKMLAKLDKEIEKYSAMEPVVAYVEESLL